MATSVQSFEDDHRVEVAVDLASLSPNEIDLIKIALETSYADARERAGSAERMAVSSIKGMLILNGGGIAILVTLLVLNVYFARPLLIPAEGSIRNATMLFLVGIGLSSIASGVFSWATRSRSAAELSAAENLLFRFKPGLNQLQDQEAQWKACSRRDALTWALTAFSFTAFAAGAIVALLALLP